MTELDKLQLRVERAKREVKKYLDDVDTLPKHESYKTWYVKAYVKGALRCILNVLEGDDTRPTTPTHPTTPNEAQK